MIIVKMEMTCNYIMCEYWQNFIDMNIYLWDEVDEILVMASPFELRETPGVGP
jgi:hypothetical protein